MWFSTAVWWSWLTSTISDLLYLHLGRYVRLKSVLERDVNSVICAVHWQVLDNSNGDLCNHYPSQLVILEYIKSSDCSQCKSVAVFSVVFSRNTQTSQISAGSHYLTLPYLSLGATAAILAAASTDAILMLPQCTSRPQGLACVFNHHSIYLGYLHLHL